MEVSDDGQSKRRKRVVEDPLMLDTEWSEEGLGRTGAWDLWGQNRFRGPSPLGELEPLLPDRPLGHGEWDPG